jgi:hypothetical protein
MTSLSNWSERVVWEEREARVVCRARVVWEEREREWRWEREREAMEAEMAEIVRLVEASRALVVSYSDLTSALSSWNLEF